MPVRKIPKNYLGVTGGFASRKNHRIVGFESLLEKDHMIVLEYEDSVEGFEEQPVRISVKSKDKRVVSYVPDILIHYRSGRGKPRKPCLGEIKSRNDLAKNSAKYAPKFAAAKRFAAERGWEFRIFDETDIRIPRLANLKFLREYHLIEPSQDEIEHVLSQLRNVGGWIELADLLNTCCEDDEQRLQTLPVIWHLVTKRLIEVNLDQPFTDRTPLALPKRSAK